MDGVGDEEESRQHLSDWCVRVLKALNGSDRRARHAAEPFVAPRLGAGGTELGSTRFVAYLL